MDSLEKLKKGLEVAVKGFQEQQARGNDTRRELKHTEGELTRIRSEKIEAQKEADNLKLKVN